MLHYYYGEIRTDRKLRVSGQCLAVNHSATDTNRYNLFQFESVSPVRLSKLVVYYHAVRTPLQAENTTNNSKLPVLTAYFHVLA